MDRGGGGRKDSDIIFNPQPRYERRNSGGNSGGRDFRDYDIRTGKISSRPPRAIRTYYDIPEFTSMEHFRQWARSNPNYKEWYNAVSPEVRWDRSLEYALATCPRNPNGSACLSYMELLVDCPPEKLEGYNLPPPGLRPGTESQLLTPLELKDPCKMWKTMLKWCRTNNTHDDSQWMCVPYEGFVQDDCPSDKRDD